MNSKLRSVLTVAMVVAVTLAPIVGFVSVPAAAASTTDVSVTPANATATADETKAFDIVVNSADGGVGAWEGTLNLTDGTVANITNVSSNGDPVSTVEIADDNNSVYFDAYGADTEDTGTVSIVTVTVQTTADGETGLNLTMDALGDEGGASYAIDQVNDGSLAAGFIPKYTNSTLNTTSGTAPVNVNASATVENTGGASGTVTVPLIVNGETVATKDVTLAAGESTTVSFAYEFETHGEYDVSIGSLAPITISVNGPPSASVSGNTTGINVSESVALNASGSTDPDGDALSYTWDLDNDGTYGDAEGEITSTSFDRPGSYNVSVRVTDGDATDTATVTLSVTDVTDPAPAIVVDTDGDGSDDSTSAIELGTTVTLNASNASDNVAIDEYDWQVVGPTDSPSDPTATLTSEAAQFTPSTVGEYNVTLKIVDTSGNNASRTESFTVTDTSPPKTQLSGPEEPIVNITTTFDASNTTDNGDVVEYQWDFDGDGTIDKNTSSPSAGWKYTSANETYTVSVTAVDQSNNTDTATLTVNTTRAPVIEVASPADGAFTNEDPVDVSYSTDNLDAADVAGVEYRVDGGDWQSASSIQDATISVAELSEGEHGVTFRLVNSDGTRLLPELSATTATVNFTVDRTSPTVALSSPSEGRIEYGTSLNFSISDDHLQNVTYRFEYSNGTVSENKSLTKPYTVSTAGIPEGTTAITIFTTDKAGNVASQQYQFDLVSKPNVDGLSPNATVVNTTSPTVQATFSDDEVAGDLGVNTSAVTLAVNGEDVPLTSDEVTSTGLSTQVDLSPDNLDNSTHTLTLTVVDEAGHETTKNVSFTVDALAPRVTLSANHTDRVSEQNPVEFTVASDDARPETTWVNVTQNGSTVRSTEVTGSVVDSGTTLTWDATDEAGNPVANGEYNVTIRSVDTAGNVNTVTKTVTVDTEKPTVSVDSIDSGTESVSPAGGSLYVDQNVTINATANGTPGQTASVTFVVQAMFTNFETTADATLNDGTWTATIDESTLPGEGNYTVVARTTDPAGNENSTATGTTLQVDRTAPNLAATLSREDNSTARMNLTTSEPIDEATLNVSVVLGNGTEQTVSMSSTADGYTGTIPLSENGTQYLVTATASDLAGNTGTDLANATIVTTSTTNKTVTVKSNSTGTFIQFNTTAEVNNTFVTVTASDTPLRPLTSDLVGASFLNGQLGQKLTNNLDNATIGIPVTDAALPDGVAAENVTIRRYNATQNSWVDINTTVQEVTLADGTNGTYWVANVQHFSTYGAVAEDNSAPDLSSSGPSGDLAYGETSVNVRFEYSDELSDVNASAVELYFDGTLVTSSTESSITGSYATYNATGLTPGETYTATVRVVDEAGNVQNYTTQFTAVDDTAAPAINSISPTDGSQLPASTDTVTISADYGDDVSGVDTSNVEVYFDGTEVTSDADIGSSKLSYTVTGLTSDSSHKVRIVVTDNAGNGPIEKTVSFSINASATGDDGSSSDGGAGGGGGGGGGLSGPEADFSVTVLDDYATVTVKQADIGSTVDATFDTPVAGDGMTIAGVSMEAKFDISDTFRIEVHEPSTSVPDGVQARSDAIGYFAVKEFGVPSDSIGSVGFEFTVESGTLPADATPEDVTLYRYHDGEWQELETTHKGGTSYSATSPGLSKFAIVVEQSDSSETETESSPTETATTETATETTSASSTPTETSTASGSNIPGFSVFTALLATIAGLLFLRRRRQSNQ